MLIISQRLLQGESLYPIGLKPAWTETPHFGTLSLVPDKMLKSRNFNLRELDWANLPQNSNFRPKFEFWGRLDQSSYQFLEFLNFTSILKNLKLLRIRKFLTSSLKSSVS